MDLSTIQEIQSLSVLKTMRKLMERLFQMRRGGKVSAEDYVQKIERLRAIVEAGFMQIEKNEEVALARSRPADRLHVFILEHLEQSGCFETAHLLADRFSIAEYSDLDFYKQIWRMVRQIEQGDFEDALTFCKEHRAELKTSKHEGCMDLENDLKIEKFVGMCHSLDYEKALEFANREFKRIPEQIKSYLPALVSRSVSKPCHLKMSNQFQRCALALFKKGDRSRLARRVEYGMMAYKTYRCAEMGSRDCPACCKALRLREDVPFNKHEISILLCRGSREEMDDTNQPYAFEDGLVYGARHIESLRNVCITPKTDKQGYPKLCFIL